VGVLEDPQCHVIMAETDRPQAIEVQRHISAAMTAADFVCIDHVEGISFVLTMRRSEDVITCEI